MTTVRWEPKQAAYRDLVLLALHRRGGELRDDEGGATALLLEACGIVKSRNAMSNLSTAARMMQEAGLIKREVTAGNKRTYLFKLSVLLSDEEVGLLSTKEGPNRILCEKTSRPSEKHDNGDWLTPLFEDCLRAQKALRDAFEAAENKTARLAVFNATKVLEGVGIKGGRADEVRYYLQQFSLARATAKFEKHKYLWWWEVSFSKELDLDKLCKKAMGPRAYGGFSRRAPLEETPETRRHAKGVPSRLDDTQCTPVVVRQKPAETLAEAVEALAGPHVLQPDDGHSVTVEQVAPLAPVTVEDVRNRFEELILGIDELERDLAESQDKRKALEEERSTLILEHEKALRGQAEKYEAELQALRVELEAEKTRADAALNELNTWAGTVLGRISRRLRKSS